MVTKGLAWLRLQVALQLEYRVVMWIWLLTGFALPLINLAVWTSIARYRPVAGFSVSDFISYFLAVMGVGHFVEEWSAYHWEEFVRQGQLSPRLLRPLDPIWELAAENAAYKIVQALILIPVWGGLWKVLGGAPYATQGSSLFFFGVTLILAAILNFLLGYCLALLAFWTVRVTVIYEVVTWGIGYFLSGRLAPMDVLPHWVNALADGLPFRYIMALPVEVLMGRIRAEGVVEGIMMQLFWILIFLFVRHRLWHWGLRRYTAVGG